WNRGSIWMERIEESRPNSIVSFWLSGPTLHHGKKTNKNRNILLVVGAQLRVDRRSNEPCSRYEYKSDGTGRFWRRLFLVHGSGSPARGGGHFGGERICRRAYGESHVSGGLHWGHRSRGGHADRI